MIDSLSRLLCDDKIMSFPEAKTIVSDIMEEIFKKWFLHEIKKNEDKNISFYEKLKNVILGYLTYIFLDKAGLRPIRESFRTKNNMQLWTTQGSRFHSDFLPIENSLTGKEIRNDEKLI